MPGFLIINQSSAPELTPAALDTARGDLQLALDRDFAPEYGLLSVPIRVGTAADDGPGWRPTYLVDQCDDPGAIAYHSLDAQGKPFVQVGVENARKQGGPLLDQLTLALGHEFWETILNAYVADYVRVPDIGRWQAKECVDPVQAGSYRVGSTLVPDFVTRAYWDVLDTEGPWAKVTQLAGPLTIAPGGYRAFFDGTYQFGEHVTTAKREHILRHGRVAFAQRRPR